MGHTPAAVLVMNGESHGIEERKVQTQQTLLLQRKRNREKKHTMANVNIGVVLSMTLGDTSSGGKEMKKRKQ